MSLQAQVWVASLPLDVCGLAEFRVLDKLADHAHRDGRNAWRSVESMAAELRCSKRTVQRALSSLQTLGLIKRGDQHYLDHLRADRRPTVWDLPLDLFGVTTAVTPLPFEPRGDMPVDNSPRGDRHAADGVTPGVAIGTKGEPLEKDPEATPDRATGEAHRHVFLSRFCELCGLDPHRGERVDFKTGLVRSVAP